MTDPIVKILLPNFSNFHILNYLKLPVELSVHFFQVDNIHFHLIPSLSLLYAVLYKSERNEKNTFQRTNLRTKLKNRNIPKERTFVHSSASDIVIWFTFFLFMEYIFFK